MGFRFFFFLFFELMDPVLFCLFHPLYTNWLSIRWAPLSGFPCSMPQIYAFQAVWIPLRTENLPIKQWIQRALNIQVARGGLATLEAGFIPFKELCRPGSPQLKENRMNRTGSTELLPPRLRRGFLLADGSHWPIRSMG